VPVPPGNGTVGGIPDFFSFLRKLTRLLTFPGRIIYITARRGYWIFFFTIVFCRKEQVMAKKALSAQNGAGKQEKTAEPKRLSKAGELMRKYPNGIIEIHDIKAVLK
jgi:hypothetical protein